MLHADPSDNHRRTGRATERQAGYGGLFDARCVDAVGGGCGRAITRVDAPGIVPGRVGSTRPCLIVRRGPDAGVHGGSLRGDDAWSRS